LRGGLPREGRALGDGRAHAPGPGYGKRALGKREGDHGRPFYHLLGGVSPILPVPGREPAAGNSREGAEERHDPARLPLAPLPRLDLGGFCVFGILPARHNPVDRSACS
jgi:hypothetical protein